MLGELDQIHGRGQRWRFSAECLGAALLMPVRDRLVPAMWTLTALGLAAFGLGAATSFRYGTGSTTWWPLLFLIAYLLAAGVLLRRPGVALPGLFGGVLFLAAWIWASGFTFNGVLGGTGTSWGAVVILICSPVAVAAWGTLRSGSDAIGRRAARLAAISGALAMYLYATLAVTVVGGGGPPDQDGGPTVAGIVSDRIANNMIFYLFLLPMITATIGWAGAAGTSWIKRRLDGCDSESSYGPNADWDDVVAPDGPPQMGILTSGRRRILRIFLLGIGLVLGIAIAVVGLLR
jgi:hypothetical protein